MPLQKILSGRVNKPASEFVGRNGLLFYDEDDGILRLGDGSTPGGTIVIRSSSQSSTYTLPIATESRLGGVKAGANVVINASGVLSVTAPFSGNYADLSNKPDLEAEMAYAKQTDFITDSLIYRGDAAPGTALSAAGWRVRRLIVGSDGDVSETWANGTANFDNIWNDRLTLSYY